MSVVCARPERLHCQAVHLLLAGCARVCGIQYKTLGLVCLPTSVCLFLWLVMGLMSLYPPDLSVDDVPMPSFKGAVRPSKGLRFEHAFPYLSPLWLTRLSVQGTSSASKNFGLTLLRIAACYGMPFGQCFSSQCCSSCRLQLLVIPRQALQPYTSKCAMLPSLLMLLMIMMMMMACIPVFVASSTAVFLSHSVL